MVRIKENVMLIRNVYIMIVLTIFAFGGGGQISSAQAESWNSDWGAVAVEADGDIFVGRYNRPVHGIIVMRHQGGGKYTGYWARSCTRKARYQIPAPVSNSEGRCGDTRKTASGTRTKCWGTISGGVNAANTRFSGTFYTCNGARMGDWDGWR